METAEVISSIVRQKGSALIGSVERVSYFNQESGQCILEITDEETQETYFISGKVPWVYPGATISGQYSADLPEKNLWRAQNLKVSLPSTERGLRKFLRSQSLVGLGPKLIKVLVKSFSTQFFHILENNPNELVKAPGVGEKKKSQIVDAWLAFRERVELKNFLFNEFLPLLWFDPLWIRYGEKSLNLLKKHPYQVGRELHLPFELIDTFALKKGFFLDSEERLKFGFEHIMWTYYKQGHCAYPLVKVFEEASQLLETTKDHIENILEIEILEDRIIEQTIRGVECLYFKEVWELERQVARKLIAFKAKPPPMGWFNSVKVLGWAQEILKINLAPLQKEAIETALSSAFCTITGGPGTGKTTLIKSLVTILQSQFLKFALCSPTGRAAQRLGEATQRSAQTIHRLLKYDGLTASFIHNKKNPLDLDLVLVDEASMVDLSLMNDLLDALPQHCALILVGDADQIPSVGAGNILHSVISSPHFPVVRLREIYRQSAGSAIKDNARKINDGQMPVSSRSGDFQFIAVNGADEAKSIVHHLLGHVIPETCGIQDIDDVQILVPLNQGVIGAKIFNEEIQQRISSKKYASEFGLDMADFGHNFKAGDKVMVLKNDYKKDVFNGDIGFIEKIDYEAQYLEVNFLGRLIRFDFAELDSLTLAYAISIHKSQGSEYKVVVVVVTQDHLPMAQRHLVYTAVTRGKDYVFLVAEPNALRKALQEVEIRWETLTQLLKTESSAPVVFENNA